MPEFVDSGLYFVQYDFFYYFVVTVTGSGFGGPKINGSDRIRILIPGRNPVVSEILKIPPPDKRKCALTCKR